MPASHLISRVVVVSSMHVSMNILTKHAVQNTTATDGPFSRVYARLCAHVIVRVCMYVVCVCVCVCVCMCVCVCARACVFM